MATSGFQTDSDSDSVDEFLTQLDPQDMEISQAADNSSGRVGNYYRIII